MAEVRHSRFVFSADFLSGSRIELDGFCDSSQEVYCAVVYLRLVYQCAVHVCFLAFSGCWFGGPLMLWSQELAFERVNAGRVDENSSVERVDVEVSAEVVNFSNTTTTGTPNNKRSISAVIDCTRYSSLKKLLLTTGYVMQFVNNLRKRVEKQHGDMVNDSVLTIDEYDKALMMWIKEEQILMKE